ncbi:MAG: 30S ribosomal protein S12 [Candidatus Micrarchaeia archaeon]
MAKGEFAARIIKQKRTSRKMKKKSLSMRKHKYRYDVLEGAPIGNGIVLEKRVIEQKQPHSGLIKCVRVQLRKNGKVVTAHVPRDKAISFIDEHDEVTVAGLGGSQKGQMGSISGVRYKVIAVNGISLSELRSGKKQKTKK